LSRVPRGYREGSTRAHYLQFKQFLADREFEAEFATRTPSTGIAGDVFGGGADGRFLNSALPAAEAMPAPEPPPDH
jgi:hypothetical protein